MTAMANAQELTEGLQLDGQQLEAPFFHKTEWRTNQRFSAKDDPDRTLHPWEPPSFVTRKDPAAQREKVTVEEIEIAHLPQVQQSSFARVLNGVLDESDCAELLKHVNRKGFTPALINIGAGMQQLMPEARDGHRVIVDSPQLTGWLFEVVKPYLPQTCAGGSLIDLNERCRILCYTPGQYFAPHNDGRYSRPQGHQNAGDCSRVTFQLYLHDVPEHAGGATNFLSFDEEQKVRCQPRAGSVLLFSQDLYHEGELLNNGLKYTLRTEAMYRMGSPKFTLNSSKNLQIP